MLSDDDLRSQLNALADCVPGTIVEPESLLRTHERQRRRRLSLSAVGVVAVVAMGVSLSGVTHPGRAVSWQRLAASPGPNSSDCPSPPSPTPRAATTPQPVSPAVDGPRPTPSEASPDPVNQGIPAQVAEALDRTARPTAVRSCDLGTNLLYRLSGGASVDVAAIEDSDTSAARDWVTVKRYADGAWLGTSSTEKATKVQLLTGRYLVVWTVDGAPRATTDLESWAERFHDALIR
jgi:hypothetical protein